MIFNIFALFSIFCILAWFSFVKCPFFSFIHLQLSTMFSVSIVRETGQFSSKGIIYDFKGNLNRITVLRLITESAAIH